MFLLKIKSLKKTPKAVNDARSPLEVCAERKFQTEARENILRTDSFLLARGGGLRLSEIRTQLELILGMPTVSELFSFVLGEGTQMWEPKNRNFLKKLTQKFSEGF